MKKRLIWNDLRANPLLSVSTWAFMSLCALLVALTCFLFTNPVDAIDVLMDRAQTPDYLQMHAGEIDEDALARFAEGSAAVRDMQVLRFLNLENGNLTLGERSLADGADVNAFANDYTAAGLPQNGPAITRSIIRLMNALSDGMMALVILLVSVVMLLISILCIRFTLLSRLEADRSEIGMLKAVGISRRDIRGIYFDKYCVLSALGAVCGLLAAAILKRPLENGLRELYGTGAGELNSTLVPLLGVALTELLLLLSISRTIRRTERLSAVEALRGSTDSEGKKPLVSPQYKLVAFVIMLSVFLMVVPQNLHSTLSSPDFVTYMGIGDADLRLDIRQTEDMAAKTEEVARLLAADGQVAKSTSLVTKSYAITLPGGGALPDERGTGRPQRLPRRLCRGACAQGGQRAGPLLPLRR